MGSDGTGDLRLAYWRRAVTLEPQMDEEVPVSQIHIDAGPDGRRILLPPGKAVFHRLSWSRDGSQLAIPSSDRRIRIWDMTSSRVVREMRGGSTGILCATWASEAPSLIAGDYSGFVYRWDESSPIFRTAVSSHPIRSVAWQPRGTIVGVCDGAQIYLIDARTGDRLTLLDTPGIDVVWLGKGQLAAATANGKVLVLNRTGQLERVLTCSSGGGEGSYGDDQFDNYYNESGTEPLGLIEERDVNLRTYWTSRSLHMAPTATALAWSDSLRTLAAGSADGRIAIWFQPQLSVTPDRILEGHTGSVVSLSFSRDGSTLASKSLDHTLRIYRTDSWELVSITRVAVGGSGLTSVAFRPSADHLATTTTRDRTVEILKYQDDELARRTAIQRSIHYTTAKLVLVGDSGVGKTGLGWRLAHGEFKEHASTHGQQFWLLRQLSSRRRDGTECEAVLWDLAGQPDYRLVHALFIGDVDIALVLFDPTVAEDPLSGVQYWMRVLRGGQQGSKVILVAARIDRGVTSLTDTEIEQFCRQEHIATYVPTSAATGENLDLLIGKIQESIDWDSKTSTVTTETFKQIKDYVLGLKESLEVGKVVISIRELRVQLRRSIRVEAPRDDDFFTAVQHLANHGYVKILPDTGAGPAVLLFPDILTNLASSVVLEARRNPKGLGAIEESRLLVGDYALPELETLSDLDRRQLLDSVTVLFLRQNLCFRETLGEHRLLVFPSLINQKKPSVADPRESHEDTTFVLRGAVDRIYPALVVLLGYTNTFTRSNQWQNQAEYEFGDGQICGFRQRSEQRGVVEFTLLYSDIVEPSTRQLFQGLFEFFLRGRDVSVEKYPPLVCSCGYVQPRESIMARIQKARDFSFCVDCGDRLDLGKYSGRASSDSQSGLRNAVNLNAATSQGRTEFETALVHVKAHIRDTARRGRPSCFISYAWADEKHRQWVTGLAADLKNAEVDVILDQWDNLAIGSSLTDFVDRVDHSDFVALIGTPLYKMKYENPGRVEGSLVKAEASLVNKRLKSGGGSPRGVLPILRSGSEQSSFPPLVQNRVYADFREDSHYFSALFELILTLHEIPRDRQPFEDIARQLRLSVFSTGRLPVLSV